MCGRITLFSAPKNMARLLDAELADGLDPDGHPSWNLGPTQRIDAVTDDGTGRILDRYRWGLIPSWAKDLSFSAKTFNARAETVATKPSFRAAYKVRRALLPIDGFYEWDRSIKPKPQPHYFTAADGGPLVCAGLWELWHNPDDPAAPALKTVTMLTCAANPDIEAIHDRMPVLLAPEHYDLWLTATSDELEALAPLLVPAPAGTMTEHAVGREVGNIRNDGAQLIDEQPLETLF